MLIPSRHSPPLTSSHVFIVDDHPIVRSGVRGIIDATEQFEVVAVAGDGMEAIERIGEVNADIVVMDLSMPNIGGIEAIKELKRRRPDVEIMVFTLHQSVHRCREAVRAGARAYVCKSETDLSCLHSKPQRDTRPIFHRSCAKTWISRWVTNCGLGNS